VLVSEHIAYFAFVHGHALLVSPSESFLLVSVPVLLVVVFFFRNFCKTLFKFIASLVSIDFLLNARTFVILNFVDQGLFFCVSESSHERHYTLELFFVFLQSLVVGVSCQVEHANEVLEFRRSGINFG
jgi:hypothetical protein